MDMDELRTPTDDGIPFEIAESPHQDHCASGTTAFTQRPRYSICWISFYDVDVVRHPAAASPFEDEP